ncbi:hypothetical protein LIV57_06765 [Chryseobacterium sp. X308]|uniref:hypothetical protein n=1 Tax=Chryseobacterium sp. X308 TaxID=2884873 RepID=UPI001D1490C7|nr:hypothetical protein [Chryseobacterium sp. X308]MCC3214969.1 hypothetical protein [Chryseobacterium sp. X308]
MKQLEITTNKRLLIVEFDDMDHLENVLSCNKQGIRFCTDNDEPTKLICKGSDLTEDIAKGFQHKNMGIAHNGEYLSAIEEFKFHISNNGYHWGDNPVKKPNKNEFHKTEDFLEKEDEYNDYESRTLNPEKCIIFEIL